MILQTSGALTGSALCMTVKSTYPIKLLLLTMMGVVTTYSSSIAKASGLPLDVHVEMSDTLMKNQSISLSNIFTTDHTQIIINYHFALQLYFSGLYIMVYYTVNDHK